MRYYRSSSYSMRPPGVSPIVQKLIYINLGVFFFQLLGAGLLPIGAIERIFALVPSLVLKKGMVWQLVTYAFLHGGFLHIFLNMIALFMLGTDVEHSMGSKEFLKLYLFSAVGGGILALLFSHPSIPIVGASGAVSGVLAAFAMLFPNRRLTILIFFVLPVTLTARMWAIIFVFMSWFGVMGSGGNISHEAHLGGLVAGALYIKFIHRPGGSDEIKTLRYKIVDRYRRRQKEKELEHILSIQERVDQLLDKIAAEGVESLTAEEREFLVEAGHIFRDRR